jgi:UDP-N-acetylglucosamine 3-dehydrogenase
VLRAAVIGCGSMGRNHLRVLAELEGVELVAAADGDSTRLAGVSKRFGARTYRSHVALLAVENPDFVVVAVPTRAHFEVVSDVIGKGVHALVEKPIAATVDEAQRLARLASDAGVLLGVGHVEHFNPAVIELKRRLDAGELGRIFQAHVRRLGPFPDRVRDVGVVLDLATHDIDVLRFLIGKDVVRVFAETEQNIHTAHEDMVNGLLRFESGVVASFDINWLTPTKVRTLTLTGERGMFAVDYLLQELTFYSNDYANTHWEALQALTGVSEGSMVRYKIVKREPLRIELENFSNAVSARLSPGSAHGAAYAPVTAEDGCEALRIATLIVQSGRTGTVIDARPVSLAG